MIGCGRIAIMASNGPGAPEVRQHGGHLEMTPEMKREMMKPLWFGNHQTKFKLFSYLVAAGKSPGNTPMLFIPHTFV